MKPKKPIKYPTTRRELFLVKIRDWCARELQSNKYPGDEEKEDLERRVVENEKDIRAIRKFNKQISLQMRKQNETIQALLESVTALDCNIQRIVDALEQANIGVDVGIKERVRKMEREELRRENFKEMSRDAAMNPNRM